MLLPKGLWRSGGLFLLAFGLLIFGLDTMKVAVEGVGQRFDVSWLQGYPPLVYLLAGVLLTAIIQSSSAAMLITLSALNGGLIALPEALALVIGADLGTTSTLLLGAIKGSVQKKQVAAFHVLYNVGTALMAFSLMMPVWPQVAAWLGVNDPLYGLVAFHTGFNLIGIVVFAPFLAAMEKGIEKHIGKRAHHDLFADISPQSVEPALLVLSRETDSLIERVRNYCRYPLQGRSLSRFLEEYEQVTDQEMQLADYANRLAQQTLTEGQEQRLQRLRARVREAVYALKALKDVADDLALLAESRDPGLKGFSEQILLALDRLYQASPGAELAAEHRLAMEKLQREAYSLVSGARLRGISVLNLAREVDESGRHWLRSLAVTNDVRQ
ncbi:Na/Pi symporter [Alcanivorax sp.]|uniref:Na/Pi symporter n=1 Tax=Alcanivorax sp. TaxID=1872427 RepID=UPI0025C06DFC|nr:Na/Pi symporter [Alcanivorax sp.]